jgi:hypothetical protein
MSSSSTVRIALADVRVPANRDESVSLSAAAIAEAGRRGATIDAGARSGVPHRRVGGVADAAAAARITVILGTERLTSHGLQISACVIGADGAIAGWQDRVQLDPSEESVYPLRCVFDDHRLAVRENLGRGAHDVGG